MPSRLVGAISSFLLVASLRRPGQRNLGRHGPRGGSRDRVARQTAATFDSICAVGRRGAGTARFGDVHQSPPELAARLRRSPEHGQRRRPRARLACERPERSPQCNEADCEATARVWSGRPVGGSDLRFRRMSVPAGGHSGSQALSGYDPVLAGASSGERYVRQGRPGVVADRRGGRRDDNVRDR